MVSAPDTAAPVFAGVGDVSVDYGADFDPLAGVTATDDVDGDVTAGIKVSGSVDTSKAGVYTLTYTVSDKAGNEATATRKVTVKEKPDPTVTDVEVTAPSRTEYTVGDVFSADGLKVSKTLSDGTTADVDADGYTVAAVDADGAVVDYAKPFAKVGKVTFTVTLKDTEYSKTFEVSVKAADKTALNDAAAKKVAADENATADEVAKALEALTDAQDALVPVTPAEVTGIEVTALSKTEYTVGDTYDAAGLVVTKVISKGDPVKAEAGEYTVSAVDAAGKPVDLAKPFAAAGKVTVTVALKGTDFAKSFEVTVKSADKTALNEVIAGAGKLAEPDYESGSDEFEAALDAAKKVAADEDATPAQVADALAALQAEG